MIEFSESQRRTIASGLTVLAVTIVGAFIIFIGWLALKLLAFASPAVTPVVVGLFLAMFFKPYYLWWKRLVHNDSLAVGLMLISLLVPLGVLAWQFGEFALEQVLSLVSQAPELAAKFVDWVHTSCPRLRELADQVGLPYQEWVAMYKVKAAQVGVGMLGAVTGIVSWLVALIFFVYFLTRPTMRGRDCVDHLPFLKDDTKAFVSEQVDAFLDIVISFFQRQVVICLLEGCYYGLGFAILGIPYGFTIGFVLGVLNLIPLFGTVTCLPIVLTLAYFGEGASLVHVIGSICVWACGQLLDGYLITPKIQGDKTGLGYAGVIFSFIFWGAAFHSLLGLLLAIPLSAFCVVLWRSLKSRYIRPIV